MNIIYHYERKVNYLFGGPDKIRTCTLSSYEDGVLPLNYRPVVGGRGGI